MVLQSVEKKWVYLFRKGFEKNEKSVGIISNNIISDMDWKKFTNVAFAAQVVLQTNFLSKSLKTGRAPIEPIVLWCRAPLMHVPAIPQKGPCRHFCSVAPNCPCTGLCSLLDECMIDERIIKDQLDG